MGARMASGTVRVASSISSETLTMEPTPRYAKNIGNVAWTTPATSRGVWNTLVVPQLPLPIQIIRTSPATSMAVKTTFSLAERSMPQ